MGRRTLLGWSGIGLLAGLGAHLLAGLPLRAAQAPLAPAAPACAGVGAQLAIAVAMLVLTAAVHSLVTVIQAELTHRPRLDAWCAPHSSRRLLLILAMALLTALALLVEILLWALVYRGLGLFAGLEASVYFSGITFTTVGYGDMTLHGCWRLLSVGEAINGVLMAGWSTAQLVYVVQRTQTLRLDYKRSLHDLNP
jgi:hypothetical protein